MWIRPGREKLLVVAQGVGAAALTVRRLLQQAVQGPAVSFVECGEHLVLVRGEGVLGFVEQFEAFCGDLHDTAAAVLRPGYTEGPATRPSCRAFALCGFVRKFAATSGVPGGVAPRAQRWRGVMGSVSASAGVCGPQRAARSAVASSAVGRWRQRGEDPWASARMRCFIVGGRARL